jgi:hypothetical protein
MSKILESVQWWVCVWWWAVLPYLWLSEGLSWVLQVFMLSNYLLIYHMCFVMQFVLHDLKFVKFLPHRTWMKPKLQCYISSSLRASPSTVPIWPLSDMSDIVLIIPHPHPLKWKILHCKVRNYLNATACTNHSDWPIRSSHFILLALLEISVSFVNTGLISILHGLKAVFHSR